MKSDEILSMPSSVLQMYQMEGLHSLRGMQGVVIAQVNIVLHIKMAVESELHNIQ